jgi:hypothetical protein
VGVHACMPELEHAHLHGRLSALRLCSCVGYFCVRVCVCACVRARVCVCACADMRAACACAHACICAYWLMCMRSLKD